MSVLLGSETGSCHGNHCSHAVLMFWVQSCALTDLPWQVLASVPETALETLKFWEPVSVWMKQTADGLMGDNEKHTHNEVCKHNSFCTYVSKRM